MICKKILQNLFNTENILLLLSANDLLKHGTLSLGVQIMRRNRYQNKNTQKLIPKFEFTVRYNYLIFFFIIAHSKNTFSDRTILIKFRVLIISV